MQRSTLSLLKSSSSTLVHNFNPNYMHRYSTINLLRSSSHILKCVNLLQRYQINPNKIQSSSNLVHNLNPNHTGRYSINLLRSPSNKLKPANLLHRYQINPNKLEYSSSTLVHNFNPNHTGRYSTINLLRSSSRILKPANLLHRYQINPNKLEYASNQLVHNLNPNYMQRYYSTINLLRSSSSHKLASSPYLLHHSSPNMQRSTINLRRPNYSYNQSLSYYHHRPDPLAVLLVVTYYGVRYVAQAAIKAWKAYKERRVLRKGGFLPTMTRREAALILGLRPGGSATEKEVKEAHRRVMFANHPDAGGSNYIATKIKEAKDIMIAQDSHSDSES